MKTWVSLYIEHTIKNAQPFDKARVWSISLNGVVSMRYYIKNKEGYYLAVHTGVTEDDYWEDSEFNAYMKTQST